MKVKINLVKLPDNIVLKLDLFRMKQVIMNLLSNALKFSKVNGTVHVKLKLANVAPPDNIELLIEVTDSGIGISEHDLPTIFTPYFKTTDPRSLY